MHKLLNIFCVLIHFSFCIKFVYQIIYIYIIYYIQALNVPTRLCNMIGNFILNKKFLINIDPKMFSYNIGAQITLK